jgi:hypothetical protein
VEATSAGHKWGRIICPGGHKQSIWSTPRSPGNHARDLMKWADQHSDDEKEEPK